MKKGAQSRLEKQVDREIDRAFQKIQGDYEQQARIAQTELERKQQTAPQRRRWSRPKRNTRRRWTAH